MPTGNPSRTPAELLALFDAERRMKPRPEPGVRYECAGGVIRVIGAWNAVLLADLTSQSADSVISEQVAFFCSTRTDGGPRGAESQPAQDRFLEWKVYGHDLPPDLGARLAAAGFEPEEPETLMVFDLARDLPGHPGAGTSHSAAEIRLVTDARGVADATAAARAAFGRDDDWEMARTEEYGRRLSDPTLGLYVALLDGRPVASARVEFAPRRSFAELWGGGTIPEYRGRGLYRALVGARAAEARRRGYRYLRVDARETSRPILERLGFVPLGGIVEWRLSLPVPPRSQQKPVRR
jgi:GNAT superfamily N-acetyltransferase